VNGSVILLEKERDLMNPDEPFLTQVWQNSGPLVEVPLIFLGLMLFWMMLNMIRYVVRSVLRLSLPKMLSGANAFEISDIERMNIGAHQLGV
jgi:hypothetical protein